MNIQEEFDHYWHHVANHSTVKPSDTFRYAFGLQDLKLKELMAKLALAEGEWKAYSKSCESLSKKLADVEGQRDSCIVVYEEQKKQLIEKIKAALVELKSYNYCKGKSCEANCNEITVKNVIQILSGNSVWNNKTTDQIQETIERSEDV